jgi:hypothetical protein
MSWFLNHLLKMKRILFLLTLSTSVMLATSSVMAQTAQDSKVLRHVVLFKFKDTSSAADVKKVEDAFRALKGKISLIKDFEWGKNTSPENLNQGLTHCFLATFTSDKDRDDYLVHPDHKAFVEVLKPHLDKVTVIDYWASR